MQFRAPLIATTLAISLALSSGVQATSEFDVNTDNLDDSYNLLTTSEAAELTFMREEEKLARDVYDYLFNLWGNTIFDNISDSEQQHFETMGLFLDKYRLPDPALLDQAGVFVNSELQTLYDTLINMGNASELDALKVGALIEETDMIDLVEAIEHTDNADLKSAYEELLRGSRNHLRAFVAQIEATGEVYAAQVLSQEEVDSIVDSPMERGSAKSH